MMVSTGTAVSKTTLSRPCARRHHQPGAVGVPLRGGGQHAAAGAAVLCWDRRGPFAEMVDRGGREENNERKRESELHALLHQPPLLLLLAAPAWFWCKLSRAA